MCQLRAYGKADGHRHIFLLHGTFRRRTEFIGLSSFIVGLGRDVKGLSLHTTSKSSQAVALLVSGLFPLVSWPGYSNVTWDLRTNSDIFREIVSVRWLPIR